LRLLIGHDAQIAHWVGQRIAFMGDGKSFGPCTAIGVVNDEQILGGVVFSDYRPMFSSIEASFASASPRWLTPNLVRSILSYPFDQLGVNRISSHTPRKAGPARRFLQKFGFVEEGVMREGFGDDDCIVSGLLASDWRSHRYYRGAVNGQAESPDAA
jgi:RimJ/RimL family protein N-acetyltransferase